MSPGTEPVNHQIDHGNQDHRLAAVGQRFIVFGQSPVTAEPRKGAFDNPAFGQHDESSDRMSFDDFDRASIPAADPVDEAAGIALIGKDQLHAAQPCAQLIDQDLRAVSILNVGRMNRQRKDQAEGVDDQMTLATAYLLARIVSAVPPFSTVFAVWLSRMPTQGVGFLPALARTRERS